jgi:hypothetical protein
MPNSSAASDESAARALTCASARNVRTYIAAAFAAA